MFLLAAKGSIELGIGDLGSGFPQLPVQCGINVATWAEFPGPASLPGLCPLAAVTLCFPLLLPGVIFNSSLTSPKLPPHVTYTIRTSVLYSMRTDLVRNPSWKFHPQSLPTDGFKYNYIFVPLQDMIERAIIAVQTGHEAPEPAAQTQAAPYPCHTSDL